MKLDRELEEARETTSEASRLLWHSQWSVATPIVRWTTSSLATEAIYWSAECAASNSATYVMKWAKDCSKTESNKQIEMIREVLNVTG